MDWGASAVGCGVGAAVGDYGSPGGVLSRRRVGEGACRRCAGEACRRWGRRGEGIAFDLLVDHDTVDHLGFDLPVQVGNSWQRKTVEWAPASSVPADGLFAPTREQFERWDAEIGRYPLAQTDSLAFFLSALRPHGENIPYTQWLSKARAAFERAMNVHVHHVPTSLLCSGEIWQMFVRAWAEHAEEWIPLYNKHLAAYRARQGIKNPQHPMPDLAMTGDMRELPFWTYVPGQPRERLVVRKGADPFGAIAAEAVIRPRALALTMFVRLFFADMFIHGIGGALYDQITDELLRDLVGVVPPYGCVSAAWLLPLGQPLENTDDIAALKWRRHHAAHNPQLAIDPFTALKTDVAELIRDRRVLVEQIGSSRPPAMIRRRDVNGASASISFMRSTLRCMPKLRGCWRISITRSRMRFGRGRRTRCCSGANTFSGCTRWSRCKS